MTTTTDKQAEMIVRIAESEYNSGDPERATWSAEVCDTRSDAGVLGTLETKGLVICRGGSGRAGSIKDATVELTAEGLAVYLALRPDSEYAMSRTAGEEAVR